jgi:trk system potassium uptake protein TrkH
MNARLTVSTLGALWALVGVFLAGSAMWAPIYGESEGLAMALAGAGAVLVGAIVFSALREPEGRYGAREAFAVVTLGWVSVSVLGALPYLATGALSSPIDALFESVSGFSTTGASVIPEPEKLPKCVLFWRSMTHWLGGMGIVVLSVAVLPFLGVGGMGMIKAEMPSPVLDRLRPRVSETAGSLWKVYILFTAAETLLLMIGGMDAFDALCHSFGTVATGGFSTKAASMGYFQSRYLDVVITIFMLAAGINFTLHYHFLSGNFSAYGRSVEFRVYMVVFLAASLFVTWRTWGLQFASFWDALDHGTFQVSSIMTTTGYVTCDWEQWPWDCQWLLLCLMFMGGCAGSTGGGMKCLRLIVVWKHVFRELTLLIHPRAVIPLKIDEKVVSSQTVNGIVGFVCLFVGVWALSVLLAVIMELDPVSAVGAVTACLSNIGPGLNVVGASDHYGVLSDGCKLLLTLDMLAGRLELFTVFVLFTPAFWRL